MSSECPRCGSALTTFTLDGAEAVGCDACGYAGVEVDHSGEPRLVESWEEALERFGRKVEEGEETDGEETDGEETDGEE
ncbi:zf-TFIIB domain-containing protein [Halorubrum rubrum]|uniref:Zf-TFIIB domain-containing protein n=1 Tax=Halorubrum rubrum TaxID=1126240 RepID=A0ABD5R2J8_9EURY|nr:zf-TFIIB domain-containing protein [Halorubrum rubrum]